MTREKNRRGLNNFQRKETSRWLLNISQATLVAGLIGYFIPNIGAKVGIEEALGIILISAGVYYLAMRVAEEVK